VGGDVKRTRWENSREGESRTIRKRRWGKKSEKRTVSPQREPCGLEGPSGRGGDEFVRNNLSKKEIKRSVGGNSTATRSKGEPNGGGFRLGRVKLKEQTKRAKKVKHEIKGHGRGVEENFLAELETPKRNPPGLTNVENEQPPSQRKKKKKRLQKRK